MNANKPPRLALWVLRHFGCSPNTEVVIGDLMERYSVGENRCWIWKQVLSSVVDGYAEEFSGNKLLMLRALFAAWGGILLFRGMILEVVSYRIYVNYIHPSPNLPIIEDGRVVGYIPPAPWAISHPDLFRFCILLCMAISGRIAARVGGEHARAALFTYASSMLIVFLIETAPGVRATSIGFLSLYMAAILVAGLLGLPCQRRSAVL